MTFSKYILVFCKSSSHLYIYNYINVKSDTEAKPKKTFALEWGLEFIHRNVK